jgi:hypothetical protein
LPGTALLLRVARIERPELILLLGRLVAIDKSFHPLDAVSGASCGCRFFADFS